MEKENNTSYMSAHDLMLKEFPLHRFCIQELLPKGLSLLVSEKPEYTKSLAMDMCLSVASGNKLWDKEVQQGPVLYITHRDTLPVTQGRIRAMAQRVPDDLYVGVMEESSIRNAVNLAQGFLKEHPATSLVFVELEDTVLTSAEGVSVLPDRQLEYAMIKNFAQCNKLTVVLMHPSMKSARGFLNGFPADAVNITDSVDSWFELQPYVVTESRAALRRTSRTYGNRGWKIKFNSQTHRWVRVKEMEDYMIFPDLDADSGESEG